MGKDLGIGVGRGHDDFAIIREPQADQGERPASGGRPPRSQGLRGGEKVPFNPSSRYFSSAAAMNSVIFLASWAGRTFSFL
jgi:hypothetical protein